MARRVVSTSGTHEGQEGCAESEAALYNCMTDGVRATMNKQTDFTIEGYVLTIKKVGNSLGFILPKDLLARLKLKEGDELHVVEQTERGIKLTPYDPKHSKAMTIA